MAAPHYTLVVPTYNRPEEFGRLLRFLASQKADFPVLVLDSSRPEVHERNVATTRGLALDLRFERFDPAMPPWEKFRRGAEMVRTEPQKKPLSDKEIVDMLEKKGIPIARRTVAKYRNELNILPSNMRKSF